MGLCFSQQPTASRMHEIPTESFNAKSLHCLSFKTFPRFRTSSILFTMFSHKSTSLGDELGDELACCVLRFHIFPSIDLSCPFKETRFTNYSVLSLDVEFACNFWRFHIFPTLDPCHAPTSVLLPFRRNSSHPLSSPTILSPSMLHITLLMLPITKSSGWHPDRPL